MRLHSSHPPTPSAPPVMSRHSILCLHGKSQSASTFSHKISGARRKLSREYDLHFLNGPIPLLSGEDAPRAWWLPSERDGKVSATLIREAVDHVLGETVEFEHTVLLGFSQGGTLATALAVSGAFPNLEAVVTAGAPHVPEVLEVAYQLAGERSVGDDTMSGRCAPKLHFAGERDTVVSVESTRKLCEVGGNGTLVLHDQGHLFPTRSASVAVILDFLRETLSSKN